MTATLQVLTCQECGSQWERTAVRGRVPKRCPDCAPLATVKMPKSDEINDGVRGALTSLDGSDAAAVSLITGFSRDEIDDLGGLPNTVEDDDPGVLVLCPACRSNNHRFCLRGELGFACECGCES